MSRRSLLEQQGGFITAHATTPQHEGARLVRSRYPLLVDECAAYAALVTCFVDSGILSRPFTSCSLLHSARPLGLKDLLCMTVCYTTFCPRSPACQQTSAYPRLDNPTSEAVQAGPNAWVQREPISFLGRG